MAERDYSQRSLMDKLGVRRGQRIAAVNVGNREFLSSVAQVTGEPPSTALRGVFDAIFLQIDDRADLARIAKMEKHLTPSGALWIFHPKGRNAAVRDSEVRAVFLSCGLVDNKITAYTETHTATRCVIPRNRRERQPDANRTRTCPA